MNIRYTGKRKVRIVGPYQWDEINGFIQEVKEQDLIDDLLTEPSNEFEDAGEVKPSQPQKKWWNEPMIVTAPEPEPAKPNAKQGAKQGSHAEPGNQEEEA